MERIFYDMQVDWDWIKQRPQFLAESLGKRYEVHAFYRRQFHRKGLQDNEAASTVFLHPFYTLPPIRDRYRAITKCNQMIRNYRAKRLIYRLKPGIIWLTHPTQLPEIPEDFTGRVVYDCMDDHLRLGCPKAIRDCVPELERRLCERADIVFASSAYLAEKLRREYGLPARKVCLLRNGCREAVRMPREAIRSGGRFRLGYIGTISDWFDFEVLRESLARFENIEYELIGPVNAAQVLRHDRVFYRGTVEHEKLGEHVRGMDCLVMPFQDVPLVRAVDPVKLYEYIAFQRNIISLDYPEVKRFAPFVQPYCGAEEYCRILRELLQDNSLRWDTGKALEFLAENTWVRRGEQASAIISGLGRETV